MVDRNNDSQSRCKGIINDDDDTVIVSLPQWGLINSRLVAELPDENALDGSETNCFMEYSLVGASEYTRDPRPLIGRLKKLTTGKELIVVKLPPFGRMPNFDEPYVSGPVDGCFRATCMINCPTEEDEMVSCYVKHAIMRLDEPPPRHFDRSRRDVG